VKGPRIQVLAACEVIGGILTAAGYASYVAARPGGLAGWQVACGAAFGAFAAYAGILLLA
jgi:hypothetical protein